MFESNFSLSKIIPLLNKNDGFGMGLAELVPTTWVFEKDVFLSTPQG